eukprot:scaffold68169_cov58-Attheya_sp.AAC.4
MANMNLRNIPKRSMRSSILLPFWVLLLLLPRSQPRVLLAHWSQPFSLPFLPLGVPFGTPWGPP